MKLRSAIVFARPRFSPSRRSPPWTLPARRRHRPPRSPLRRSCPPTRGRASSTSPTARCWSTSRRSTAGTATARLPRGAGDQADGREGGDFGVIFANARTQVDKVARTVVFEDLQDHEDRLPDAAEPRRRLHDRAAERVREARPHDLARPPRRHRSRSPASSRRRSRCRTMPPQVIVSYSPAILVPIDGAPVLKPVPDHSRCKRVINTRALILQGGFTDDVLHARLRRLAHVERHRRAVDAGFLGPFMRSEMQRDRAASSRRTASSTCSTAAPRRIRSRRSRTACRRSTRARCRPSSSCSRASPTSCRSSARSSCGRRTRRATC